MIEHANDLTALVAHDRLLHGIVKRGNREAAGVIGLHVEVDVAQVGEVLMAGYWVGYRVLAGQVLVVFGREAPAWDQTLVRTNRDETCRA